MPETFSQYINRWKSHSTQRGLSNPLVKMPLKRLRTLQPAEVVALAKGGALVIGTTSDPIARNLLKGFKTRISERGEHCAFLCFGTVDITLAGTIDQQAKSALFPVLLKKVLRGLPGKRGWRGQRLAQ